MNTFIAVELYPPFSFPLIAAFITTNLPEMMQIVGFLGGVGHICIILPY